MTLRNTRLMDSERWILIQFLQERLWQADSGVSTKKRLSSPKVSDALDEHEAIIIVINIIIGIIMIIIIVITCPLPSLNPPQKKTALPGTFSRSIRHWSSEKPRLHIDNDLGKSEPKVEENDFCSWIFLLSDMFYEEFASFLRDDRKLS